MKKNTIINNELNILYEAEEEVRIIKEMEKHRQFYYFFGTISTLMIIIFLTIIIVRIHITIGLLWIIGTAFFASYPSMLCLAGKIVKYKKVLSQITFK